MPGRISRDLFAHHEAHPFLLLLHSKVTRVDCVGCVNVLWPRGIVQGGPDKVRPCIVISGGKAFAGLAGFGLGCSAFALGYLQQDLAAESEHGRFSCVAYFDFVEPLPSTDSFSFHMGK